MIDERRDHLFQKTGGTTCSPPKALELSMAAIGQTIHSSSTGGRSAPLVVYELFERKYGKRSLISGRGNMLNRVVPLSQSRRRAAKSARCGRECQGVSPEVSGGVLSAAHEGYLSKVLRARMSVG
jgi:hypothetical protein